MHEPDIQVEPGAETGSGAEAESSRRRRRNSTHHSSHVCPRCGSHTVSRSHRRGFKEKVLLPVALQRPFHCHKCRHRFYGFSTGRRTRARLLVLILTTTVVIAAAVGITTGVVQTAVSSAISAIMRILTRA